MVDRIESWCFWRWDVSKQWVHVNATTDGLGVCQVCHGVGEVTFLDKEVYCICNIKQWQAHVDHSLRDIRSMTTSANIDELVISNATHNGHMLADAIEHAKQWAYRPKGYLVFSGGYGVGKTHIVRWLNWVLNPIALYITASDFNVGVHRHRKEDSLAVYVDRISRSPVLLFDDWGMEYGGPLVESQFAHIVDFRDRDTDSFPMAVATNRDGSQAMSVPRVGSRLMNRDKSVFVPLDMLDYRVRES